MKSLNPACKLIGLVVPTLLLAGLHHPAVNLAVFAVCLAALLLSRANVKVLAGALLPVLLVAVGMFSTGYHFHAGAGMPINAAAQALTGAAVWNGLVLGSRVLAFAGLGLLFVLTTDRILLVRSLQQQLRLPPVFAYGLLAAWGILPNMMEEYKRTRAAFAARGIRVFPSPRPAQAPAGQVGALVGGAVHRHGVQGLRRPRPPHVQPAPAPAAGGRPLPHPVLRPVSGPVLPAGTLKNRRGSEAPRRFCFTACTGRRGIALVQQGLPASGVVRPVLRLHVLHAGAGGQVEFLRVGIQHVGGTCGGWAGLDLPCSPSAQLAPVA